jgi:hypothetical protein
MRYVHWGFWWIHCGIYCDALWNLANTGDSDGCTVESAEVHCGIWRDTLGILVDALWNLLRCTVESGEIDRGF